MKAIIDGDGTLKTNGYEYNSPALANMLRAFRVKDLTIDPAEVHSDEDGGKNFAITGSAQLLSLPITVELYLDFLEADHFEFQLTATLPVLSLSSLSDHDILPNSPFVAPLLSSSFPDVKVVFDSAHQELYFGALESKGDLDIFQGLSLKKLGFEFLRSYSDDTASLDIYTTIQIEGTAIETKVEIPLGGEFSPRCWVLTSRSPIPFVSGLKDIIHFLGRIFKTSFDSLFPEAFKSLSMFFLDDLQILLDPEHGSIQYLTFRVKSMQKFPIEGGLSISDVGLRVNVTATGVSLTLFGLIEIKDDLSLDVQVMLPENPSRNTWKFFMSGRLSLERMDDIKDLPIGTPLSVSDLHLHHGFSGLHSLELRVFEVDFNPGERTVPTIAFDLQAYAECELIHGLKLKNPRLSFTADNPFNKNRRLQGSIESTITVGDINFGILAEKREKGWGFRGKTETKPIVIGTMIDSIKKAFPNKDVFDAGMPDFVKRIELNDLTLSFETSSDDQANKSTHVTFKCEGSFPVHDEKAKLSLTADVKRDASYTIELVGELTISTLEFKSTFSRKDSNNIFIASYTHTKEQGSIKLKEVIGRISSQVAGYVPEELKVDLKYVLLAFEKDDSGNKFLFGMDLGVSATLSDLVSNLPLVGKMLPPNQTIGIDNLQILFANKSFDKTLGETLASALPGESADDAGRAMLQKGLASGISVSATMRVGDTRRPLDLPLSGGAIPNPANSEPLDSVKTPDVTSSDNAKWFALQKAFGPVHFNRVGVQYKDSELHILLDASISAAGLTLSLDGLSVSTPLNKFNPKFQLRGLGIDYRNGAIQIGGALLKIAPKEYAGAAIIKVKQLTISALAAYKEMADGHPSMFVYAVLDYPIGGPSFFFVTGLAAGFGYNRNLIIPDVENIGKFPLVADAISGDKEQVDIAKKLQSFEPYVTPMPGQYFLAVGIKFTSFKVVDSFALLTVTFGQRFELNVLGLSTLIMPTPVKGEPGEKATRLAEVQMSFKASYIPDEGFLGISAQLTSASFILSKDCHLTGGFAFYSWFSGPHAGDFVLSLGGYHPDFKPPAHYPKVPRLGFNWRVSDQLHIKGSGYFAMTPTTLMAGGSLQATWESGNLKVWFNLGADFIITWKPYHYDATMYLEIGVSYTFEFLGTQHLNVNVGADLHLWGPEFSGTAHIKLWVISFDIAFGKGASQIADPISWETFKASFLPADDQICTINITNGLITKSDEGCVVNPKEFSCVTNSLIPATEVPQNLNLPAADTPVRPGIAPMGGESYKASHVITIIKDGKALEKPFELFEFTPVRKRVPVAMWGRSLKPSMDAQPFIENALAGFEIRPIARPLTREQTRIDPGVMQYSSDYKGVFDWEKFDEFTADKESDDNRRGSIKESLADSQTTEARTKLLKDLGLQMNVAVSRGFVDTCLATPQTGTLAAESKAGS